MQSECEETLGPSSYGMLVKRVGLLGRECTKLALQK